jgi:hypothetical protein
VVERVWHCLLTNTSPFTHLDRLFRNTACFLKSWSDCFIGNMRMQLDMAKEVVARLEVVGDLCLLNPDEDVLCKELKLKALGLLSLQRARARQEARMLWLHEGNAPTKFFHAHANERRCHNFIHILEHDDNIVVAEDAKAELATEFFE